jgi:membrane protease YdiL (CAAX protease family)
MKENRSYAPFTLSASRLAVVAVVLVALALAASGRAQSNIREDSHKAFADRVRAAGTAEYGRVLEEFDARLAREPKDTVAAVERCKFIDEFAYSEEETIKTANDDSKKCKDMLRKGVNAESGAIKTYLWLDDRFEENAAAEGERLLKEHPNWTARQLAMIHEGLSNIYQVSDASRAGEHAVKALELDGTSNMRIRAAEHYVRIGTKRLAAQTLTGMPAEKWTAWTLQSAVTMLLNLGDGAAARSVIESRKDIDLSPASRIKIAGSLLAAGEESAGRAIAEKITGGTELPEHYGTELEKEIFAFQLQYGSKKDATTAYRALRDKGYTADAFARHRLALTAAHWTAPWRLADLLGVFAVFAVLGYAWLLPLVITLPVHYRSVVKRIRGFVVAPPGLEAQWSLVSAWYALAVVFSVGTAALYVFSYSDFEAHFGGWFKVGVYLEGLSDDRALGRAVFWASIASLALLLPLLRGAKIRMLLVGKWPISLSILSGMGVSLVVAFVTGFFKLVFRGDSTAGLSLGTETVRSLQGVYSLYGVLGLLVCAAIVVPMVEEFVFRGVLLRSVSRHIHIWVAALLQAGVFVALHEDTGAFPFLFVFALANSLLALRSGGLLAPIASHAVNNAIASLAILGVTRH